MRVIENKEKAFVYSERRFGKTSLVKLALLRLPLACTLINIFPRMPD